MNKISLRPVERGRTEAEAIRSYQKARGSLPASLDLPQKYFRLTTRFYSPDVPVTVRLYSESSEMSIGLASWLTKVPRGCFFCPNYNPPLRPAALFNFELKASRGVGGSGRVLPQAVRTLALPPSAQKRIYPPFCDITFELVDDFDNAVITGSFKEYETTLDAERRRVLEMLKQAIERLADADWDYDDDDIEEVLSRPRWVAVRESAAQVVQPFGFAAGPVAPCAETPRGSGGYQRGFE